MRSWSRFLAYAAIIGVIAGAYFIGRMGRGDNGADTLVTQPPDPGYLARDAEVIETGYDGRERYRLNAKVIRQQTETAAIQLEQLDMHYHPGAQERPEAGKPRPANEEVWHLTSDRGEVQANGDDVQLNGNVRVDGPAPGSGAPLTLTTTEVRVFTPSEFIETSAPVKLSWSGHTIDARGMQADLKAGKLRLESEVHGRFAPK